MSFAWGFWLSMLAFAVFVYLLTWSICRGATRWDEAMRRALEREGGGR